MLREAGTTDPELARAALAGLRAYEQAERVPRPEPKPVVASLGASCIRDHGGEGPPALFIPSLINPPRVLDLDPDVSLTTAVAAMGRRALLLDWGPADARSTLDVAGHVSQLLVPLLARLAEPAALVGYCLGGTMSIAAANLAPTERVATLAAPWNFCGYGLASREALAGIWQQSRASAQSLGALPMEVLQGAFWSLDPARTVRKFAEFGRLDAASVEARRFVQLEDWANEGEPLPYPAARELIEDLFGADATGSGSWKIGGKSMSDCLNVPLLNITADRDTIAPAASAPTGNRIGLPAGHVGMIVGSAHAHLHEALAAFLTPCR